MDIKNNRNFLLIPIITIFFSCSPTTNKEEIELELKYNVGDKQTITCNTETSRGAMMQISNKIVVDFEIIDVDSQNVYRLSADIKEIKSETKMEGLTETYHSKKSESDMTNEEKEMHLTFKDVLDSVFRFSINKKGAILKPFEYSDGRPVTEPIVDMDNIQLVLPDKKLKIGDTWENERINSLTGQKIKSVYTIKDTDDSKITIRSNSTISGVAGLLQENKVTGEYILDKKSCQLKQSMLEMNMQTGGKVKYTFTTEL